MSTGTFRFSTDILQRLGEELITSLDQGVVELVKNSYDADAASCTVELVDTGSPGGAIVVEDDGDGMSLKDIREGWLVLGRSQKAPEARTKLGRLPAGSKGLGRLGAIRMGQQVEMTTRPRSEPGVEYALCLHWADFDRTGVVEDVELDIRRSVSSAEPGTRVEIRGLERATTARDVRRLARELLLLADPFAGQDDFRPVLKAKGFREYEELVRRAYFDDCEFRLIADVDRSGIAKSTVLDRSGSTRWTSERSDFDDRYDAPVSRLELWSFLLQGSSFAGRAATVTEVRRWLEQVGGVHLYHRGIRVRPYGDPGHDWLDMNLARVRDPELRPSTNTSVGRVTVLDQRGRLVQRTDRTGFIENQSFRELRRFAVDALEWMHVRRIEERDRRKAVYRRSVDESAARADRRLRREIDKLPPRSKSAISRAASQIETARASERDRLREELGLYKTLASVGTAVSVFAHEIEGPATELTNSVEAIERRTRKALGSSYETTVGKQVEAAKRSARLVARFATLPLHMLKRSKRRTTQLDVNIATRDLLELFEPYLTDARVAATIELCDEPAIVRASTAELEAIVSNLLSNAVKAFNRAGTLEGNRNLVVRTEVSESSVLIFVLDNGPGIDSRLGDSVWLPGITSDEEGTGMGLTIVRDTVNEMGGAAQVTSGGELGGADVVIRLPRVGAPP